MLLKKCATRLCGGDANGVLMPANVVSELTPEMRIYSEESFPVVGVIRAKDEEESHQYS